MREAGNIGTHHEARIGLDIGARLYTLGCRVACTERRVRVFRASRCTRRTLPSINAFHHSNKMMCTVRQYRGKIMREISDCPNCVGTNIYVNTKGISGGGYAANYLPGLGSFLVNAKFYPVVCEDCGLTRFFADAGTTAKLKTSRRWQTLP